MPVTAPRRSFIRSARFAPKPTVRRIGGKISETSRSFSMLATSATTNAITICDGPCLPSPSHPGAPLSPNGASLFRVRSPLHRGPLSIKRRNLWHFGSSIAYELWHRRNRLRLRDFVMATEILVKDLRQAFEQARELDGSMAERLDVFADATRKLHPSTSAIVDRLVTRLKQNDAGKDAPKPG